jgi:hypothetical protein
LGMATYPLPNEHDPPFIEKPDVTSMGREAFQKSVLVMVTARLGGLKFS